MRIEGKKYRIDELIARTIDKTQTKLELREAIGIGRTRMNEICRATFADKTTINTDQLFKAAAYFGVDPQELLNTPPYLQKTNQQTTNFQNQAAAVAA